MSTKFKIKGKVVAVDPIQTVGQKGFRKRTFVVSEDPDAQYPDCAAFELKGGKTDHTGLVTEEDVGREAEITFYVESRRWDAKDGGHRWFTSAVATAVDFADMRPAAVPCAPEAPAAEPAPDDLPF